MLSWYGERYPFLSLSDIAEVKCGSPKNDSIKRESVR